MEKKILILCKVVDNYGDIGVVYRLAKALSNLRPELFLTIAVSDLESFRLLCPKIVPSEKIQQVEYGSSIWKVVDWSIDESAAKNLVEDCSLILECFQCGRPEWLENILFSDDFKKIVQIVNIDYLTAEEYADDFHLLKSGTRKASIKKINFMPGFTKKTGGLILGEKKQDIKKTSKYDILIFAYERDFSSVVQAIRIFEDSKKKETPDFAVRALVAAGKSAGPFMAAWEKCGKPFKAELLEFMPQEDWDMQIQSCDFAFVRGEDSLSRACLSGNPFVWHAYVQEEDYQLVKVNALLERMRPFFKEDDFAAICDVWREYNTSGNASPAPEKIALMLGSKSIREGFGQFSQSLFENGDLAKNLLDYIDSL